MKLFKHYKDKFYKIIGEAKHSESEEDLVIYEALYENSSGKNWVRPKKMFFENVEINGKQIPRFKEIKLEIKQSTNISDVEIQMISLIVEKAFGQWDPKWFFNKFNQFEKFHLLLASVEGAPAAFKLGYEHKDKEFYSWLGGVLPEFRGVGIAADLMKAQHTWCKDQGYKKVLTKTQNRFRDMLLLNIRFGFNIVGYDSADPDGPKILLEKEL